ncbi:MAG: hypothetical protein ACETV1_03125 [Candidatus Bathyarchaeia archaeon]
MSTRVVKIVERAVIWTSATALFYLLFNANSPIYIISFLPYLDVDLSFLTIPFTVLFIFLFASSTSSLLLVKKNRWKDVTLKGLYGSAISAFILALFLCAPIPAFATAILFPLELTVIVSTGVLIVTGLLKHPKRYEPLLAALYPGMGAYALYNIEGALSQVYEPIAHTFLPFTVGLLAVSAGLLFGLFREIDEPWISRMSEWIYEGPIRNFTLGFFVTTYIDFVRPSAEVFPPIVVGEWFAIAVLMAVMLNASKGSSKPSRTDPELPDWRKHIRETQRQTGHDFEHLVSAQEKFVNQGAKEPLLVYLALTLHDLGKTEERILTILSPLMHYHDWKPLFRNLPWTRKKLAKENQEARRKLLEKLIQRIEKGG